MMHRLSVVALLVLLACGSASSEPAPQPVEAPKPLPPPATMAEVRNVDVEALAQAEDAGEVALLLDVRTPEEYASGHVPGAQNLPLDQLGDKLGELQPHKDQEVWVICQSGGRSSVAAERLAAAGFKPVNVKGGTGAWKAAGHPVE
ncbi:MAG: rhodanese-like domain-containing protein [Myxococcota bacterium]